MEDWTAATRFSDLPGAMPGQDGADQGAMPYRALDGRINFVLFSGGIVRRVYPDPASMNGWSVEQVYYPVSGTRYVRIVSCPSQGTDGTDALLVYGFGTNPATMNVVRYAVGASGGLQARDSLPTTHQPGGFPLVPEISLPSGYYVPEFALADGGGTQWDGVGLVLRSLSNLAVYPVAATAPLPSSVLFSRPDAAMRILRANSKTFRYLTCTGSGANGVIREVVLTGPGPGGFSAAHVDVAQVSSPQQLFHVTELAPGRVTIVIPELQANGLQITELDGSYNPASRAPIAWNPPRISFASLPRPDFSAPSWDGTAGKAATPGHRAQLLGVTGVAASMAGPPRLFLNIVDPDAGPSPDGSFETWAFKRSGRGASPWLPGRLLGGPASGVTTCLPPRADGTPDVSPAVTLYCTRPQFTSIKPRVPAQGCVPQLLELRSAGPAAQDDEFTARGVVVDSDPANAPVPSSAGTYRVGITLTNLKTDSAPVVELGAAAGELVNVRTTGTISAWAGRENVVLQRFTPLSLRADGSGTVWITLPIENRLSFPRLLLAFPNVPTAPALNGDTQVPESLLQINLDDAIKDYLKTVTAQQLRDAVDPRTRTQLLPSRAMPRRYRWGSGPSWRPNSARPACCRACPHPSR